jgi:flagellar motor switch protein FliN/FliY
MTVDTLQQYAPSALEALRSFLGTLLGDEAAIQTGEPSEVDATSLQSELDDGLVVGTTDQFFVALDQAWVELVSSAMLGRSIELDDEGVDDLFREIASQGYGSIRNQLAGDGVKLPDVTIDPFLPGTAVPSLGDAAWRVPFQLDHDGTTYGGYALFPAPSNQEASEAASAGDGPQEQSEAPQDEPAQGDSASQSAPAEQEGVSVASANFSELGEENIHGPRADKHNFELLSEVKLEVSVELGRRRLPLSDVLQLTSGSVIELEKLVGEPLSLYANGRFVAEGEAVVIDEKFGIRITNLAPQRQTSDTLM